MSDYNLDNEDKYIPFIFNGNEYQLWFPTTEEVLKLKDNVEYDKFMLDHIKKPEGATYPEFVKVKNKMTIKQTLKFRDMLKAELGLDG